MAGQGGKETRTAPPSLALLIRRLTSSSWGVALSDPAAIQSWLLPLLPRRLSALPAACLYVQQLCPECCAGVKAMLSQMASRAWLRLAPQAMGC